MGAAPLSSQTQPIRWLAIHIWGLQDTRSLTALLLSLDSCKHTAISCCLFISQQSLLIGYIPCVYRRGSEAQGALKHLKSYGHSVAVSRLHISLFAFGMKEAYVLVNGDVISVSTGKTETWSCFLQTV